MFIINWLRSIFSFLFSYELWLCLGCMLLALLIWGYGPLLALGDWHPLLRPWARGLLIGLLALALILHWRRRYFGHSRLVRQWLERSRRRRAEAPVAAPASRSEMQQRFQRALWMLRDARLGGHRWSRWLDRVTGQYAYRLPWYLVLGSAGSGKSRLIQQLVPAAPGLEWEGHSGEGQPTRAMEWHLGDLAVLVDSPGRFIEASEEEAGERREFHQLLRRFRPRQALNGVLLVVDTMALLAMTPAAREEDARRIRSHLQSFQDGLAIDLPIYLVFTKLDRLRGFGAYFHALDGEGREQIWGFTAELAERGAAQGFEPVFRREFAALRERLERGLIDVLADEPELPNRGRAYLFPQEFASLQAVLGDWVGRLGHPSRYEQELWLRGAYFTSNARGGERRDPVLAALQTALQLAPEPGETEASGRQSFFSRHLLDGLIVPEAGLAGTNRRIRLRQRVLQTACLSLLALVVACLIGVWIDSYRHNRDYLAEVAAHASAFQRQFDHPISLPAADVAALGPMLQSLQQLPESRDFDIHQPPFISYRDGLYQGHRIQAATDLVYQRGLDEKLLPQAASRIQHMLAGAPPDDLEYSYDALKAYLMLYQQAHYDPEFLSAWLIMDLEKSWPERITRSQRAALEAHITRLFQSGPLSSPFPIDEALVHSVRERLARYSLPERAYHLLQRQLLASMRGAPISVESAGGPQAAAVLVRKSGQPLDEGIAPLYTYQGYWKALAPRVGHATLDMQKEDQWVLGSHQAPLWDHPGHGDLDREVKRLYFTDYIRVWDAYLNDLSVVETHSVNQSMQLARMLSASDSPLKRFMLVAARETSLLRDQPGPSGHSLLGRAQARFGEVRQSLTDIFGTPLPAQPGGSGDDRLERMVDDHFAPLHAMIDGSGPDGQGPSPLDGSMQEVDQLYNYLTATDAALNSGNPPPPTDIFNKLQSEAGRLPMPYKQIISDLAARGSAQVNGAVQHSIDQDASGSIGRLCRQTIAGRYPFVRGTRRDVSLDDFARMFAPQGLMDSFYQKNLANRVDMNTRRWSYRPDASGSGHGDPRLLRSFQNAETIRDVFFAAGGNQPSLSFEITPLDMDASISQFSLDVDGQILRYTHGPQISQTMHWPVQGGSQQVSLELLPASASGSVHTHGPWALQRLFDDAELTPGAAPESFTATFHLGARRLVLQVTAHSAFNPFRLPEMAAFACPQ